MRTLFVLMCLLLASSGAAAGGATKRSSAKVPFDATIVDGVTAQPVEMYGLVRIQARVRPLDETVEVRASLNHAAFFAFADGTSDPALDALKQRIAALRVQIAELQQQLLALQAELQMVMDTDVNPILPGTQIDKERAAELKKAIAEASSAMKRLVRELADAQQEIEATIKRLVKEASSAAHRVFGKAIVASSACTGLVCDRLLTFGIVRPDGSSSPFQVRLRLAFSPEGRLVSDGTEPGCHTTLVCGVDAGECYCP